MSAITHTDRLPIEIYSAAQIRARDAAIIAAGTPGFELMQRAARATWQALSRRWPSVGTLTVLAGSGNNAGDGYLVAELAHRAGWRARVLALGEPGRLTGDAAQAHACAREAGVPVAHWSDGEPLAGVLIDALLGIGADGEVRAEYRSAIEAVNRSACPVVAIDIPSGLHADTGGILGAAIQADLTVTYIGLKPGLLTGQGPALTGELLFDDLQSGPFDSAVPVATRLAPASLPRLSPRSRTAHKGQFGQVLVIGGDLGTGGAALLTAESALRAGAGMVTLATRPEHVTAALARRPEVMTRGLESTYRLGELVERADVLVVGPGLGQEAWGRSLLSSVVGADRAQVWDADALNLLAAELVEAPVGTVLTPHPGEAARLLGCDVPTVEADRPEAARRIARRHDCIVVLKGAGSLVAAPDGRLALCDRGHPAMAAAGLGDVLAGLIGALRGQGLDGFDAACLAVWLHACAGERLGEQGRGLAAADVPDAVRNLLEEFFPCVN
ncbi:NAD(P)H-hydrate dehydratase [Stutzerimonas urumqiensis]|uniref:NAD(P)H-hydrate dehydratase n=1 Tax=Stutzerimonas urumqiensis TaxID=638269 RepID=UPI003BAC7E75